ncbi:MAG: hypothetical protein FWG91_10240 [Lachnospiraceae bacterium]|nr:hypothetical protein [Lachnospiraceae bacterium]
MQKIFKPVLEKMIKEKISGRELKLLLHIARYQDDHGTVTGVNYDAASKAAGICRQSFYDARDGLVKKGIIIVASSHYGDCDITILGNEDLYAAGPADGTAKPSYLSLHHPMFKSAGFGSMKVRAKLIAMMFIIYAGANDKKSKEGSKGHYKIKPQKFFEQYGELLDVKMGTLRQYLTELRRFFSIYIKNAVYYIMPKVNAFASSKTKSFGSQSDSDLFISNLISVALRRRPMLRRKYSPSYIKKVEEEVKPFLCGHLRKPKIAEHFLRAFNLSTQDGNMSVPYINKLFQKELAGLAGQ